MPTIISMIPADIFQPDTRSMSSHQSCHSEWSSFTHGPPDGASPTTGDLNVTCRSSSRRHPIWRMREEGRRVSVRRMAGGTSATERRPPAEAPSESVALPVDAGAPERRPGDIARLILGVLGIVLAGLWAQTGNNVDA